MTYAIIALVAGIYQASLAWGLIPKRKDRQDYWEKWDEEFGGMVKVTSIILIAVGLLLLLMEID